MKLILVRHGKYTPSTIDPEESLSEDGKDEVKNLSKDLHEMGIIFDKIYSSPKKRARQTALLLSSKSFSINITLFLKGDHPPDQILDHIKDDQGSVLLVGHNPFMGELAQSLGINTHFHTAGCLIIENKQLIWSNN